MFNICESFLIVYECTFNLDHDVVLSRQRIKLIWDAPVPAVQISDGQGDYACAAFHCGRDLSVCFLACSYILDIRGNCGLLLHSRQTGVTALICFVCWLVHLLGGRMLQWIRCSDKSEDVLILIKINMHLHVFKSLVLEE